MKGRIITVGGVVKDTVAMGLVMGALVAAIVSGMVVKVAHADTFGTIQSTDTGSDVAWTFPEPTKETLEQMVERKAAEYGVDANYTKKIIACESNWNPKAVNWQGSSASGLMMFTRATWLDGNKWRGLNWSLDDRFDAEKNVDMAMWFVKKEGWGRWACTKIVK